MDGTGRCTVPSVPSKALGGMRLGFELGGLGEKSYGGYGAGNGRSARTVGGSDGTFRGYLRLEISVLEIQDGFFCEDGVLCTLYDMEKLKVCLLIAESSTGFLSFSKVPNATSDATRHLELSS